MRETTGFFAAPYGFTLVPCLQPAWAIGIDDVKVSVY